MSQIYYPRAQNICNGLVGLLIDTNDSMNSLQKGDICGFRPFKWKVKTLPVLFQQSTAFAFFE